MVSQQLPNLHRRAIPTKFGIDFDSYLTEETMQWLQLAMASIGHPEAPGAKEFFINGLETVPLWYHRLLEVTRTHDDVDAIPHLAEQPRPFVALRRQLMQVICQQYGVTDISSGFMVEEH